MKDGGTIGVPNEKVCQSSPVKGRPERAGRDAPGETRRAEQVRKLFEERYIPLCRLAAMLLDDASLAEEVVQEAFVRLYSSWWRIRKVEAAPAYLRTIVVNLCRSRLRRKRVQFDAERAMMAGMRTGSRVLADGGNDVGGLALSGSEYAGRDESEDVVDMVQVARAVSALPPRQKAITVLRYWADLPESEIAAVLGCSVGTVKSQLAKSRGKLARLLADPAGEPQGGGSS
ncbi:MAG: SigE family RNA polymerase sigma factor [Acidimicrobiales bacterium]